MSETIVTRRAAELPREAARPKRWSAPRVAGTLVLTAWAGLFWYLLLSERRALYLSTRTEWVVPVAAILLTVATLGRLASSRVRSPESLRAREAGIMALMVVPVVIVMALPPATLGSFSAGKRSAFVGTGIATSAGDIATGQLTLIHVAAGQTSPEGERALARRAGDPVQFVGFVTRYADTPADELMLTRYVITCCVSDATVVQVRVVNVPPGRFVENDWVEVTGTIYPLGREVIVDASDLVEVARPERPYLTP